MGFAVGLQDSLRVRGDQASSELARGHSLERVLTRHLLAVEELADGTLLTSILLLDPDGKTLRHAAAPNLPQSYCDIIDGTEIGPKAGSCGTAAFFGRPVYVTDIASDPLWDDYRHLALPHGLRSCWSTPIRDRDGGIIGTFAIYHRTIGGPTEEEIDAIRMITDHVAQAIMWARGGALRIVRDDPVEMDPGRIDQGRPNVERLPAQRGGYSPIFSRRDGDVWVSWEDAPESLRLGPADAVEKMMRNILEQICPEEKPERVLRPVKMPDDRE